MTLVETSVAIDFMRSGDAKMASLLKVISACLCGITRTELLQGAKSVADRQRLMTFLNTYATIDIDNATWDMTGDLNALLRQRGITVPFQDAVIAGVAIANGIELWTRDRHFKLIQSVVPQLKLFQEPP